MSSFSVIAKPAKILLPRILLTTVVTIIIFPLIIYSALLLRRPPRSPKQEQLFQGITYERIARSTPRPVIIHIVAIDLNSPGIKLRVTPGQPGDDGKDIHAQTTSDFLQTHQLQLAINGSFFYPAKFNHFWDFAPKRGDRINFLGELISDGILYKEGNSKKWSVLCISESQQATLARQSCPPNTREAIAGREIFILDGQPVVKENRDSKKAYPRTAVGIDRSGKKLWFVLVDGRQPHYSEGMTIAELTDIFLSLGADKALNFDGGGSATLAIADGKKTRLLNSPIDARIPLRQRAIANHIGLYALPNP